MRRGRDPGGWSRSRVRRPRCGDVHRRRRWQASRRGDVRREDVRWPGPDDGSEIACLQYNGRPGDAVQGLPCDRTPRARHSRSARGQRGGLATLQQLYLRELFTPTVKGLARQGAPQELVVGTNGFELLDLCVGIGAQISPTGHNGSTRPGRSPGQDGAATRVAGMGRRFDGRGVQYCLHRFAGCLRHRAATRRQNCRWDGANLPGARYTCSKRSASRCDGGRSPCST